jgi:hypothetical protein
MTRWWMTLIGVEKAVETLVDIIDEVRPEDGEHLGAAIQAVREALQGLSRQAEAIESSNRIRSSRRNS